MNSILDIFVRKSLIFLGATFMQDFVICFFCRLTMLEVSGLIADKILHYILVSVRIHSL